MSPIGGANAQIYKHAIIMRTITLGTLLKNPRKVIVWTQAGEIVQVTERGAYLWTIKPDRSGELASSVKTPRNRRRLRS